MRGFSSPQLKVMIKCLSIIINSKLSEKTLLLVETESWLNGGKNVEFNIYLHMVFKTNEFRFVKKVILKKPKIVNY